MLGFLCETQGRPPDVRLGTCGAQSSGFALRLCFVALVILCWVFFRFFSSPSLPHSLGFAQDSPWLSWSNSVEVAFWFAVAQANAGGCLFFLFWALQFCSFVSILFPCEGDRRVLAVLRPGVHLWNLAQVLISHHKIFSSLHCLRVVFALLCVFSLLAGLVGRSAWRLHLACTGEALVQGQEEHRLGAGASFQPSRC